MKSINLLFNQILLLVFVFIITGSEAGLAQSTNDTYRHISSRDGLSSGFVWDMMEDRNGFIWIATNNGLDKYDGYSVTNYRNDPNDPNSITQGQVYSIMEDLSGMIWVGTATGLSILDPSTGRFYQVRAPQSTIRGGVVRALVQSEDGTIWVATTTGLYHIPVQDYFSDTLKIDVFDTDVSGEPLEALRSLTIDDNTLWIGAESNFHKFDINAREFIQLPSFDEAVNQVLTSSIWALLVDSKGTLWISSTTGLAAWHKGEDKPEVITELGPYNKDDLARVSFQSLFEDNAGRLWIGTDPLGAIRFDLDTGEVKTYRHDEFNVNSIREDDVHYAFVDSEGNTWFGYHNFGMSLMYSHSWNYDLKYASEDHAPEHRINYIWTIKEDAAGNLWFATNQGLVLHPADGSSVKNFLPFTENVSNEGFENGLGFLWVFEDQIVTGSLNQDSSFYEDYIYIFDIQSETFDKIVVPDSLEIILFNEYNYTDEYLYLGSLTRRLVLLNRSTYELSTIDVPGREEDDFNIKPVLPMMDREGNILIQSVYIYQAERKQEWDSYIFDPIDESFTKVDIQSPQNIVPQPYPPTVSNSEPGIAWTLLNIGLLREDYLNGVSQLYFEDEASILNETQIMYIHDDRGGYLWLGGSSGITKLDPVTETFTYYDADQSRMPIPFSQPYQLSNGDLVFPGRGGYIQFNPNELTTDESIQKVHITELWTGSDIYPTLSSDRTNRYELEYANNNISVAFLGLNYRDPNFTRYRYRLNGYDNEWNSVGTQRRVFLANLPPGEYTFQVQAATRYGGYSENTDEINIAILPPWWRTIPAYIMYALLFIGGVITVDRVQRKRVISKERERSREKELAQAKEIEKAYKNLKAAQKQLVQQEKLASLGQLTAGIAHEIKNPLNFVNNFSELSLELIEEVREEVKRQKTKVKREKEPPFEGGAGAKAEVRDDAISAMNKDSALILEILDDIETNLRKIHEHGSRADSIVKSMLQHSRGGDGKMEPTPLNPLIKEYVNLAFHGMRAGKKPINVDIDLQLDESVGIVPLIAEDFSRVILNLCNNAFDAMREKALFPSPLPEGEGRWGEGDYKPKLTVRTKSGNGGIVIEVEDNGPGILDEIKDKILQPFFTTKKGTEGTGLGLSITNDIVKAHGGVLSISSKEKEGTCFIIKLPKGEF